METSRAENVILQLNKSGLSYLTHQQYHEAFQYFKQCEKIVTNQLKIESDNIQMNKLAGITYNNLACYYKKTNKPKISLIYLQRALAIQINRVQDWSATASTHLNICAIHSFLNQQKITQIRHQAAANHAQLAITMLAKIPQDSSKKYSEDQLKSILNLNILGHYNLAIELEHLKRYEQSIQQFIAARELAMKNHKKHAQIIGVCEESIQRLRVTMNQLKNRLIQMVTKKRDAEEKGHYSFMRRNKRSLYGSKSKEKVNTQISEKVKQMRIYDEKPFVTKNMFRVKTTPKSKVEIGGHKKMNSSFSYL